MSTAEVIATDNTVPLHKSAFGVNRYVHDCEHTGNAEYFFLCQNIIGAVERGQKLHFQSCVNAINEGKCKAVAMRDEEKAAGHALYFLQSVDPRYLGTNNPVKHENVQPKERKVDKSSESYQRGRYGAKPAPVAKPTKKQEPKMNTMDMGQIVSDLAAQESKPKPVASPSIKPMPGESPLEYAKRRKAALAAGE